ncbi:hypothetical protein CWB96_22925 [Pseudoalteromonas citrea]|uniref:Uncharacterized protein n=1 Tax=Pseudoalteromonas citrea TaxID=43655 RepID=A0A5S3XD60_9GAMM|nr:hypothetical protein CWB96_22925 [Pseudoalteromonas citrea]
MLEMDKDARRLIKIVAVGCYAAAFIFAILLWTRQQKISSAKNNEYISLLLILTTVMVLKFARNFKTH